MNKRLTIYDEMIKRMTESLFGHIKNLDREGLAIFLSDLFPVAKIALSKTIVKDNVMIPEWMLCFYLIKNWVDIMNTYRVGQLINKEGD